MYAGKGESDPSAMVREFCGKSCLFQEGQDFSNWGEWRQVIKTETSWIKVSVVGMCWFFYLTFLEVSGKL